MESDIFYQLSIVMIIAAMVSLVARIFRQPMVIAYIVAGFVVGPSLLNVVTNHDAFESFSQIGITLLLFIIGLGLNITTIKDAGKPVALAFLTIITGIGLVGAGVSGAFGFTFRESVIMATALLFSSTIIVVKSLSDKKEQNRLYGQIATGVLLVEDLAATLVLLAVSASTGAGAGLSDVGELVLKGAGLAAVLAVVGGYIMPRLSKLFAASQELLYVFAIAWAFGIASAFHAAGFSIEVGALFAGVSLASLPYVQAISTKLKPLRDFFLVLFFVSLGEALHLDGLGSALLPALALSALVLIGKPLLIMMSLGSLGYTKQTSFKTAVHLSQISEFSVILVVLAYTTGMVGERLVTIATLTALITIAASAYLMKYDDRLYNRFQKQLSIFERATTKRELKELSSYPLVLLGYRQGGSSFVQTFRKMRKRYIVIDYNPDVIESLERQHINHLYGDATDMELLEEIGIQHSEMVVSTIDNADTNVMLARHITSHNDEAVFICHAARLDDAEKLYKAGATYVMMPQYIGNMHINEFLGQHGNNKKAFTKYRRDHLLNLGGTALK
jgi:Kef-type K+ transport system membrane component KefB